MNTTMKMNTTKKAIVDTRIIYITEADMKRLRPLLEGVKNSRDDLNALQVELELAHVVPAEEVPTDVITMNSRATLKDLDSGELKEYRLIFPTQGRQGNDISILAPIGTAMLGYRVGDIIEWQVPRGIRRLEVVEVLYQPEAQGTPVES